MLTDSTTRPEYVANGDLFKARPDGSGRTQLTHHGKLTANDQPDW
jgi:hypothetical protein